MTFKELTPEQQKEITDKLIEFGYKKSKLDTNKYENKNSYIRFTALEFLEIEVICDRIAIHSYNANISIFIRKTGISIS